MDRLWIGLGALIGLVAVAMAAMAAHMFDATVLAALGRVVDMLAWHALALLVCGVWAARGGPLVHVAAGLFVIGLVLFAGSVCLGAMAGIRLPMVAPVGGSLLMLGWLVLAVSAFTRRQ